MKPNVAPMLQVKKANLETVDDPEEDKDDGEDAKDSLSDDNDCDMDDGNGASQKTKPRK